MENYSKQNVLLRNILFEPLVAKVTTATGKEKNIS